MFSADRYQLISYVSRAVIGEKPLREIVDELARGIKSAMAVDACVLRRLEGKQLTLLAQCGVPQGCLAEKMSADQGLAQEMIATQKPIAVFDADTNAATAALAAAAQTSPGTFKFRSFAGAPLIACGRVIGLLGVYSCEKPRQFSELDLEHLQIIASHVAVAIENERLYREIQEKNRQLEQEVEQRQQAEKRLWSHSFNDGLTGIPNRQLFSEHIKHSIDHAHRSELSFSLLLLDLDRFKVINDSLGHEVGDKLLIAVAGALQKMLRPGDILARLGGDEFGFLLEDFNQRTDAHTLVDRVQRVLSQPFRIDDREVRTSASIGIVDFDSHYTKPDEMLRDAETAMYQAKARGLGKHRAFTPDMRKHAQRLYDIEVELGKALDQNGIFLEYQPIIEIASQKMVGFEALARWKLNGYGLIPPADFVHIAEETDRIGTLGEHVLFSACRQAAGWKYPASKAEARFVTVNISAQQLMPGNLPQLVRRALGDSQLNPQCLCLELTENILLVRPADTIEQLNAIRELGVKIYIDDFGTGYSSLSYLDCLPIDAVKIDQSFIAHIGGVRGGQKELIPAIVNLAHSLGFPVIAEGVETPGQLQYLRRLDVDFAQGNFVSPPMPCDQAGAICRKTLLAPENPPSPVPALPA